MSKEWKTDERLPDDATPEMVLEKYSKIVGKLNENGISLASVSNGMPTLEDKSCGFLLTHNISTWFVWNIDDVVEMIVSARDKKFKPTEDE